MAQRLAQGTHNPWVGSSNLSGPTTSERSACPSRAGGYASLCASTHPRKNLTHSIASSQCQTAGGTTVGSIPLVDASISLGPSHAPHPRRHLRAVCVARVRDLRGLAAPLGDAECTTAAPLGGAEWRAHVQRSSGAVEVDGTGRQHDGQGHLAYPREGASAYLPRLHNP